MSGKRLDVADLLHAYVDDELSPEEHDRIGRWLANHPRDAHRVADWRRQKEGLRTLYAAKTEEPAATQRDRLNQAESNPAHHEQASMPEPPISPPLMPETPSQNTPLTDAPASSASTFALYRTAAALLWLSIGLAGGAVGTWYAQPYLSDLLGAPARQTTRQTTMSPDSDVEQQATAQGELKAHRVYTPKVHHPLEVGSDQQSHLAKWFTIPLEPPLTIPELSAQGLNRIGGRRLSAETGPLPSLCTDMPRGTK